MDFEEALARHGFTVADERPRRGTRIYQAHPNSFLTYSVHVYEDGTALLTWEFAIVDYLATRGMQLGSGEALNIFMFPARDDRGPQDAAWLVGALDGVEAALASLRFDDPEPAPPERPS